MEALHLIYQHWFITCLIVATTGFWVRFPAIVAIATLTRKDRR